MPRWVQADTVTMILVGVDGSSESLAAVRLAARLARPLGAAVTLVSVLDTMAATTGVAGYAPVLDWLPEWRADAQRDLQGPWSEPLREAGVPFGTRIEEGRPDEVMVRMARELQPDFVVVGNRGLGHFRQLLLGSVGHALALHAHCPVIVVPHGVGAVSLVAGAGAATTTQ